MESPDKIWDDVQYRVDDNTATNNISFWLISLFSKKIFQSPFYKTLGSVFMAFWLWEESNNFVSRQYGGWREKYLIPCVYNDVATREAEA